MKIIQKVKATRQLNADEGITLLEIMVAVIVIGILAAIIVPLFGHQQKAAIEASIKQDLRNAGVVMRTESTKTPSGRMLSYLPSYASQSAVNEVTLDRDKSNEFNYCLVGYNPEIGSTFYYSSSTGKISTQPCPSLPTNYGNGNTAVRPPVSGGNGSVTTPTVPNPNAGYDPNSFTVAQKEALKNEKVIMVSSGNVSSAGRTEIADWFVAYGFKEVSQLTESQFLALTPEELKKTKLVILNYRAWGVPGNIASKAYEYYNAGGLVIHDGNDTSSASSPFIATDTSMGTASAMFKPTFNQGLSPVFPYTFQATAFASDSNWRCVLTLQNGAVAVADHVVNNRTCITLYAAASPSGGKWVGATYFYNGIQSPIKSSVDWLIS